MVRVLVILDSGSSFGGKGSDGPFGGDLDNGVGSKEVVQIYSESSLISSKSTSISPLDLYLA